MINAQNFIAILMFAFQASIVTNAFANSYEVESVLRLTNGYHPTSVLKINDKGNVIGLHTLDGRHQIFFYDSQDKSLINLEQVNSFHHSYPLDFNNEDTIVGYTDVDIFTPQKGRERQTHIILWKDFAAQDLTSLLGTVNDVKSNQFLSINDSNTLAGFGFKLCDKTKKNMGSVVVTKDKKNKIKTTTVNFKHFFVKLIALNENGDGAGGLMYEDQNFLSVGHGSTYPKTEACLWSNKKKKIIFLGNLPRDPSKYSYTADLNDNFQAVGSSEVNTQDSLGNFFWRAFFWENNQMINLGSLELGEDSLASSINNLGEVVGVSGALLDHSAEKNTPTKGFYWTIESGMQDLNSMIDKNSGWKILWAKDINNSGQIVAFASNYDGVHVVVLTPIN